MANNVVDTSATLLHVPRETRDPGFLYPGSYPPGHPSASSIRSGVPSCTSTEMAPKTLTSTTSFAMTPSQLPKQNVPEPEPFPVDDQSSFNTSVKGKDRLVFQNPLEGNQPFSSHCEYSTDIIQAPIGHQSIYRDGSSTLRAADFSLQPDLQSSRGNFSGPEAAKTSSNLVPQMESNYAAAALDLFAGQPWAGDGDYEMVLDVCYTKTNLLR
ncbi:hypothetical protein BDP81DRAFT_432713 [Colletotrichum phormii]|uniref:Uncharacterized protein n=1 Tax=Colletotrichum phormii TaxID=359342 RepID=A0AAI9ZLW0_9PEZI|nr:uncharacterized protein BDP81DRAFT_432713 [Colletotrichum phormii]KAK1634381.1 hypothetical protein BDP81DRAFT_432713 [Colletotrichum phormii]